MAKQFKVRQLLQRLKKLIMHPIPTVTNSQDATANNERTTDVINQPYVKTRHSVAYP